MQNEWGLTPLDGIGAGLAANQWGITLLDLVGPQGSTGESGPQGDAGATGATGPQGAQGTPTTPVSLASFSAGQIGTLAVTNGATLYRLSFFPISPVGADFDNASPDMSFPDAFTVRIETTGEYLFSCGVNFTWGSLPSVEQTVELAITDTALTFAYASQQREIVVSATRQNEAFSLTRSLQLSAGDELAVAVQSITGGPLPGADAFGGWLSVSRVVAASSPPSWEIGGNSFGSTAAQQLSSDTSILRLFNDQPSFEFGGTAGTRTQPLVVLNGGVGLQGTVDTAAGTQGVPAWTTSLYRRQRDNGTGVLPAAGPTGAVARIIALQSSVSGLTGQSGNVFGATAGNVLYGGGAQMNAVRLPARSGVLAVENPGFDSWSLIGLTPFPLYQQSNIEATPDAATTEWWVKPGGGWTTDFRAAGFSYATSGQWNFLNASAAIRVNGYTVNVDSAMPGSGNGWQITAYYSTSRMPTSAPTLTLASTNFVSGTSASQTLNSASPLVTFGGAVWLKVTVLGTGAPSKIALFTLSSTLVAY